MISWRTLGGVSRINYTTMIIIQLNTYRDTHYAICYNINKNLNLTTSIYHHIWSKIRININDNVDKTNIDINNMAL